MNIQFLHFVYKSYGFYYICIMKEPDTIIDINFAENIISKGNTVRGISLFFIESWDMLPDVYKDGKHFFVISSCCIYVTQGTAECTVNRSRISLQPHSILLVPQNAVVKIDHISEDFGLEIASVSNRNTSEVPLYFKIDDTNTQTRFQALFDLFRHFLEIRDSDSAEHTQIILINEVVRLASLTEEEKPIKLNQVVKQFFSLLYQYGNEKHSIAFYAEKLSITPNWLSSVIKQKTGQTVNKWIMTAIIQNAKINLAYSDISVTALAGRLGFESNSDFSRVFKQYTQLSPSAYRSKMTSKQQGVNDFRCSK